MAVTLASRSFDLADADDVGEFFYKQGWTDGLPIVPPTESKVAAILAALRRAPSDVVALVAPRMAEATAEKIAINMVMAGCAPEHAPVVAAAVDAMCQPTFNLHGIQTTTNPVAPLNCGRNALGPGRRANAAIGRAIRFVQQNVGGAIPGEVDKSTLGMPGKYTFCFGEDEENSPWAPLHVERGFAPSESVATVIGAQGTQNVCYLGQRGRGALDLLADAMAAKGNNNVFIGAGQPLVVLPSGHARRLAAEGFSKGDVQEYLWEASSIPEASFDAADIAPMFRPFVHGGRVRVTRRPAEILVVVAGGPEPYHITYLPSFGETEAISRRIDA